MENKKTILSVRIKELRVELGLTQEELAKKLGLNNKSSIANYESGYSVPSDDIKLKMCKIFDCSMDYLMGKSDYKNHIDFLDKNSDKALSYLKLMRDKYNHPAILELADMLIHECLNLKSNKDVNEYLEKRLKEMNCPKEELERFKDFVLFMYTFASNNDIPTFANAEKSIYSDDGNNLREQYKTLLQTAIGAGDGIIQSMPNIQYYMCPVYGRIAAGQPNWVEECMEGRIPIDPALMNIINPEECYFLRVNGESMNKVIKNGAYALIRKTDWVENGEIAVVLVNGYDATLKKFTKQDDLIILEPMSDNPNYSTQVYGKDTEIKVIGKYIGKMEMN